MYLMIFSKGEEYMNIWGIKRKGAAPVFLIPSLPSPSVFSLQIHGTNRSWQKRRDERTDESTYKRTSSLSFVLSWIIYYIRRPAKEIKRYTLRKKHPVSCYRAISLLHINKYSVNYKRNVKRTTRYAVHKGIYTIYEHKRAWLLIRMESWKSIAQRYRAIRIASCVRLAWTESGVQWIRHYTSWSQQPFLELAVIRNPFRATKGPLLYEAFRCRSIQVRHTHSAAPR